MPNGAQSANALAFGGYWRGRAGVSKRIKKRLLWEATLVPKKSMLKKQQRSHTIVAPVYLERIKMKTRGEKNLLNVSVPVTEKDCIKWYSVPWGKWKPGILTCWISIWNQKDSLRISTPHHLNNNISHTHGALCIRFIQIHSTNTRKVLLCASHTVLGSTDSAVNKRDKNPCLNGASRRVCVKKSKGDKTRKSLLQDENHHENHDSKRGEQCQGYGLKQCVWGKHP